MFDISVKKIKSLTLSFLVIFSLLSPSIVHADGWRGSWKPPFIPVEITISEDGIDISGTREIVTFWGTFSMGYDHNLKDFNKRNLILVIRNRNLSKDKIDRVYEIKNGNELSVFTNGSTLVETDNGKVIIDVTNSKNMKIQFAKDKSLKDNSVIPMELNILHRKQNGDRFSTLTNNSSVKLSSKIKMALKTNKNAYVYIFHLKGSSLVYRLFPMKKLGKKTLNNANPVSKGSKTYLPSKSLSFILEDEVSKDSIYFIALKKKDSVLEGSKYQDNRNNKKFIQY